MIFHCVYYIYNNRNVRKGDNEDEKLDEKILDQN